MQTLSAALRHIGRTAARRGRALGLVAAAAGLGSPLDGQSLRGSPASVDRMYNFARRHDLAFHQTPEAIDTAVRAGRLVPLVGTETYELTTQVGWPAVTPETHAFIEAFAAQYVGACGTPLVLTSASRPLSRRPRNSVPESVHPTGIAIDFRRPPDGPCRTWLRAALVKLEEDGSIEAIEERRPPHLHVAILVPPGEKPVIPPLRVAGIDPLATPLGARLYAATLDRGDRGDRGPREARGEVSAVPLGRRLVAAADRVALEAAARPARSRTMPASVLSALFPPPPPPPVATVEPVAAPATAATTVATTAAAASASRESPRAARDAPRKGAETYRVRPGDSLWGIARRHKLTVERLVAANQISRNRALRPGTVLKLP